MPLREAAAEIGVSYQTVYTWTKKPLYQAYEAFLLDKAFDALPPAVKADKKKLEERYVEHSLDMQDRLLAIVETTSDAKLQAQIAQDWLDRTPGGAISRDDRTGNIFVIPENVILTMMKRAQECGLLTDSGQMLASPDSGQTVVEAEVVP
jgi:hypothetical protein